MKKIKLVFAICITFLGLLQPIQGQVTSSVYSRFGLGEPLYYNSSRYRAMGGLSIGAFGKQAVNIGNPASYTDLKLTTLDFSVNAGTRFQQSGDVQDNRFQAGINQFAFGFPSNKSFALVLGFGPQSGMGYELLQSDSIEIDGQYEPYEINYQGSGSINKFFIGAGFSIFKKLRLGTNINVVFGNLNHLTSSNFDNAEFGSINHNHTLSVRGISPQLGVQYQDTLKFNVKVDELKQRKKEIDFLNIDFKEYQKQLDKLNREKDKLTNKAPKVEVTKSKIEKKRNHLAQRTVYLKSLGQESLKDLSKNERKAQLLLQKKKKINIGYLGKVRKNKEAIRRYTSKQGKISGMIRKKQDNIAIIIEDPTKRFTPKTKKILLNIGATYEPGIGIKAEQLTTIDNFLIGDTIGEIQLGKVNMPTSIGGGISISDGNKFMLGIDVQAVTWATMRVFGEESTLKNTLTYRIGGEWTPEPYSRKYGERISYRAGAFMKTGYYDFDNFGFAQVGFSLGAGLPLRRPEFFSKLFSRINLGIEYTFRGTAENGLIKENMILGTFGINLKDRWFIKTKID